MVYPMKKKECYNFASYSFLTHYAYHAPSICSKKGRVLSTNCWHIFYYHVRSYILEGFNEKLVVLLSTRFKTLLKQALLNKKYIIEIWTHH